MSKSLQTSIHPLSNLRCRWSFGIGVFLLTMVSGAFITSLIPVQYQAQAIIKITPVYHAQDDIEYIQSDEQYLQDILATQIFILRNDELFNKIITTFNLTQRKEFNRLLDPHRGLTDKIIEEILSFQNDKKNDLSRPLKEQIIQQLNTELNIIFYDDHRMEISYSSASPYLARSIVNAITDQYMQINDNNVTKTLIKKADLPKNIAIPDLKTSLYCVAIMGIILGVLACLYINPKSKADEMGVDKNDTRK